MTAIVGIFCNNGVVIGSDSSSTFVHGAAFRTIEQPSNKVCIIDNNVIIVGTGPVGVGQRFCAIVKEAWQKKFFQNPALEIAKGLTAASIDDLKKTFAQPGMYGSLVAFPAEKKHHLCEFALSDFQPEFKTKDLWYCSMGVAQPITDPFLGLIREIYWHNTPPDLNDGIFAATWTLDHAIKVNPGGVNGPIKIAILESRKGQFKAREIDETELAEHRQHIEDVKDQLRKIRSQHRGDSIENIPDVPKLD